MQNIECAFIDCPYCGERIEMVVDCSVPDQEYIEDCSVCCRPIVVIVAAFEGEVVSIEGRSEDE